MQMCTNVIYYSYSYIIDTYESKGPVNQSCFGISVKATLLLENRPGGSLVPAAAALRNPPAGVPQILNRTTAQFIEAVYLALVPCVHNYSYNFSTVTHNSMHLIMMQKGQVPLKHKKW